jgi:hypothetical protein
LFEPASSARSTDALTLGAARRVAPITAAETEVVALDITAFWRAARLDRQDWGKLPTGGARTPLDAAPIEISLADGRHLRLTLDTVARGDTLHATWIGDIAGIDGSRAWITTDGRAAYGLIDLAGERYSLEPVDGGATALHYLHRLDLGILARNRCLSDPLPEFAKHYTQNSAQAHSTRLSAPIAKNTSVTVGLIIYWSPAAAQGKWSLTALAWSMIDSMNDALALAEIPHRVTLQLTRLATFTESGDPTIDLFSSALIPGLDADRTDYHGDVVITITDASANLPDNFIRGSAISFARHEASTNPPPLLRPLVIVTDDWATGDFTFSHELGHSFGAAHSPFDPDSVPWITHGRGHMNGPSSWFTLMGGYDTCSTGNPPTCPSLFRINRWSSVKAGQSYLGLPIGVVGVSEVDRTHETLMPSVAALK